MDGEYFLYEKNKIKIILMGFVVVSVLLGLFVVAMTSNYWLEPFRVLGVVWGYIYLTVCLSVILTVQTVYSLR